mmetsp:Transcript_37607/g.85369  ORF Transcript_37607/g.85369 Transcript_37607/m.85369 type:complete len:124 (+) Transcript_37607:120-491(+)
MCYDIMMGTCQHEMGSSRGSALFGTALVRDGAGWCAGGAQGAVSLSVCPARPRVGLHSPRLCLSGRTPPGTPARCSVPPFEEPAGLLLPDRGVKRFVKLRGVKRRTLRLGATPVSADGLGFSS